MNNIIFKTLLLKGEAGNSIFKIEKTATSGLVDTYTITLTDGSTSTFEVTNGSNIASIEKTATSGLVDTYTVTLTNGSTTTFEVTNGNGISSIDKTGTSGLVDTYTITFTNGTTTTFEVTNGANGSDLNLATVEDTAVASKAYVVGEHLLYSGEYYIVTQAIAQGGALTIGTNIVRAKVGDEISNINGEIANINAINTFNVDDTAWTSNTDPLTLTDYPYIYTISSNLFNNNSAPIWQIDGAGNIPTETERESINFILEAYFSTSGVTLYASDLPMVDLRLTVKGV